MSIKICQALQYCTLFMSKIDQQKLATTRLNGIQLNRDNILVVTKPLSYQELNEERSLRFVQEE